MNKTLIVTIHPSSTEEQLSIIEKSIAMFMNVTNVVVRDDEEMANKIDTLLTRSHPSVYLAGKLADEKYLKELKEKV